MLTKVTDSYTQSQISYTYNNDFLINSITYAGKKEDIAYNLDSEVISIGNYQISRDNNGFVSKVSDSNYQKEYSYNSYGEVSQIKDNTLTVNLTRNKLSQIIKKEEIINNRTITYEYVYDKLGRLTKVTKDGKIVEEYTYDENSNRIAATVYGKSITATYNNLDQLISYNNINYTYDKNGNLIKKENDTNQTSYSYDDFNNLKEVTLPDGKKISYITNPLNQRVAKLVNGEIKEKYLWKDLTTLLAVYDKDNNLIQRFEYANGRMPIAMTDKNNNRYYLHYDQVGSLRAIIDSNGNLVKEIVYNSYGNIISDTNPDFKVPFGFAGGLYDGDTKLVHFGYREYDPEIGRWLSKDPLLFGGGDSNLYGYVLQDPVNLVDPFGLAGAYSQNFVLPDGSGWFTLFGINAKQAKPAVVATKGLSADIKNAFIFNSATRKSLVNSLNNISIVTGVNGALAVETGVGAEAGLVLIGVSYATKGLSYYFNDRSGTCDAMELGRDSLVDTITPPGTYGVILGELLKQAINTYSPIR